MGIALEDQEYKLSVVTLEEANAYVKTAYEKSKKTVIAVILFLTSVVPLLIALALLVLIPSSSINEAYKKLLHEDQFAFDKIVENKRIVGFSTFYWPLVVAIYLGWSLWTGAWGITWIIWPIAALVFAALVGLLNFIKSDK
ncbi:MAG: hypothetical protein SCL54_09545 [Bacillota bacterium]|nr:hypothetical protein [Bacillota bacterium]